MAMAGAGILVLISGLDREFYLASVEWETLLFIAGLFVMVGALVKTGVIENSAHAASHATAATWVTTMLILGVSFLSRHRQQRSLCRHDDADRRRSSSRPSPGTPPPTCCGGP